MTREVCPRAESPLDQPVGERKTRTARSEHSWEGGGGGGGKTRPVKPARGSRIEWRKSGAGRAVAERQIRGLTKTPATVTA